MKKLWYNVGIRLRGNPRGVRKRRSGGEKHSMSQVTMIPRAVEGIGGPEMLGYSVDRSS
jgi:hypothetical protein